MRLKMFCIYDSKVEAYMTPWFLRSRGEGLRAISEMMADKDSRLARHPADYTLFEIGEFDDSNGVVTMHAAKVNLGVALEFLPKSADQLPMFPPKPNAVSLSAAQGA